MCCALVLRAIAQPDMIDQQATRYGFCGSGYGTRPCVLVFVESGYDDPKYSERTPNAPRMGKGDKGGNSADLSWNDCCSVLGTEVMTQLNAEVNDRLQEVM